MPRCISFSMTEQAFITGAKDVTRRLGWEHVRVGERLMAVRQCMGLRRGEKQVRLGLIEVRERSREPLNSITPDEVRREGFPGMPPAVFVALFCKANRCPPDAQVTRLAFVRVTE